MASAQFDDDLEVGKAKPTTTANNATVGTADLDVDWNDNDAMTTGDGLNRIVPPEGGRVRTAVLTDVVSPKRAFVHFIRKADGSMACIRCQSVRDKKNQITEQGLCCKKLNGDDRQRAQLIVVVLALKYVNADPQTGKYDNENPVPIRYELGFLKLSPVGFKAIRDLVMEDEHAHDFDVAIGKKGESKGYQYVRVAKKCRFRADEKLAAEVLADAAKWSDGVALSKRLGRVVTEIDLKALLAGQSAASKPKGDIDNTDDL